MLQRPDDVKRLHTAVARAFEYFAGLGDAMIASTVLQTAVDAYRDAGLPDDSKRVRILMQEKIRQSRDHLVPIETGIEVSHEDIEQLVTRVVSGDLPSTFTRIAAQFLPRK
jgi:lysyl-tRNA synthetase class 1